MHRTKYKANYVRPCCEQLEERNMLAGGILSPPFPIPAPSLRVTNQPVAKQDILPGATGVGLAELSVRTNGHGSARLGEVMFLSADGSEFIAPNTTAFRLMARNGTAWTTIAYSSPDFATDTVDFLPYQPIWVRPGQTLQLEVVADFGSYLTGSSIGVQLAFAGFYDLRSTMIPDANVAYTGVSPVVHQMEPSMFAVYQMQLPKVASTVNVGDKRLPLFEFNASVNNATPTTMTFVASQGSLQNGSNYVLEQDANWDGIVDDVIKGMIIGNKLVFNLDASTVQGGKFDVYGNAAQKTTGDPYLQLAFDATLPLTATDATTGSPLKGLRVNSSGAGQLQVSFWPYMATTYTIVTKPTSIIVNEVGAAARADAITANAVPGNNIVLDTFTVTNTSVATVNHVAVNAIVGDLSSVDGFTLWADTNGNGIFVQVATGALVGSGASAQVTFDNFQRGIAVGQTNMFQIRGNVKTNAYGGLQVQLASTKSIAATDSSGMLYSLSNVFVGFAFETYYVFPGGGYG